MSELINVFFTAFVLAAGLIMAIGAQNAHVLRQGIAGHYVGITVILCAFFDTVLMTSGVFGFGWLLTQLPMLEDVARLGGAVFLLWYGGRCVRSAMAPLSSVSVESRVATEFACGDRDRIGLHFIKSPCVFGYGGADWQHRWPI